MTGASFILYAPTFDDPIHFDDPRSSTNNTLVKKGDYFELFRGSRGLAMLSFGLNYRWTGFDFWWWHFVNVLLFSMIGPLLMFALLLLRPPDNNGQRIIMGMFSLLFVVHPMATQAVAYLSQRSEIICAGFSLSAFAFYLLFRGEKSGKRWGWFFFTILSTYLAVKGKDNGAALPFVFLAAEIFLLDDGRPAWKRAAFLAGTSIPVYLAMPEKLGKVFTGDPALMASMGDNFPGFKVTGFQYLLSGQEAVWKYLLLSIFPYGQTIDHHTSWSRGFFDPTTILAFAGLFIALCIVVVIRKKLPVVSFGLAWFWLFLAPVTTLFPLDDLVAEHRAFVPIMGLVFAAYALFVKYGKKPAWMVVLSAIIIIFIVATVLRVRVWGDDTRLWRDAVIKSPLKARPWNNLGMSYVKKGRISLAKETFEKAVALDSGYKQALGNLANCCVLLKDWECAVAGYSEALDVEYNRETAINYLKILVIAKRHKEVAPYLETLLPTEAKALKDMGKKDPILSFLFAGE